MSPAGSRTQSLEQCFGSWLVRTKVEPSKVQYLRTFEGSVPSNSYEGTKGTFEGMCEIRTFVHSVQAHIKSVSILTRK